MRTMRSFMRDQPCSMGFQLACTLWIAGIGMVSDDRDRRLAGFRRYVLNDSPSWTEPLRSC